MEFIRQEIVKAEKKCVFCNEGAFFCYRCSNGQTFFVCREHDASVRAELDQQEQIAKN